jgi:hypothetical protein
MDSEMTLVDQPSGKELEYRAVAMNKAGDGEPSDSPFTCGCHAAFFVRHS